MRVHAMEVTIDGRPIIYDDDGFTPLSDIAAAIGDEASGPTHIVMSNRVARQLTGHMTFESGALGALMSLAPHPVKGGSKRRDTKPAPKPRKRDKRGRRDTRRQR